VAALLTWASLNIVGGGPEVAEEVRRAQREVYEAVDRQVVEWGIEHNEEGWRADAYLYCNEVVCPECGWRIPLAPSWVIGEKSHCVAKLRPNEELRCYDILIHS
jgi:putative DNA methylase